MFPEISTRIPSNISLRIFPVMPPDFFFLGYLQELLLALTETLASHPVGLLPGVSKCPSLGMYPEIF